ncbi:transposase [Salmonella enterica subsp. enterica]|nr:transposase [Salmonella enterica subsp. enterica serovar Everleigh]ECD5052006.1 transposase [Salmonella enterica subsp. enterica serovar Everleigh]
MRAKERFPRKRYSPEFKMKLVRLALEQEGSITALARQHDVNDNQLFKWIKLWQREGRVCHPRKKNHPRCQLSFLCNFRLSHLLQCSNQRPVYLPLPAI